MQRMTVPQALKELNNIATVSKDETYPDIVVDKETFIQAVETLNNYHKVVGELVEVISKKVGV